MENLPEEKKSKVTLPLLLSYVFGGLFFISALGILMTGNIIGACMIFIMAAILFPPSLKQIEARLKMNFSKGVKFCVCLVMFFVFSATNPKKINNTSVASAPQKEAVAIEEPSYINDSCRSVSDLFDAQSNLTDLQKDEIWSSNFANKHFKWDMEIVEVSKGTFGGYTVQFKCSNSRSFVQDVLLEYPEEAKSIVMGLQKDKIYKITGKLERQSTLLGIAGEATFERSPASN